MEIRRVTEPPLRCLQCGCPREHWPEQDGYGVNFCCEGCASGGRCTCGAAMIGDPSSEELTPDAHAGPNPGRKRRDSD